MAKAIRAFNKGQTLFDGSSVAASYKLFQYQAGTTTKANTYTDATKGTANSNPMTLNADGRLDQDVYIDQSMKFVLATSAAGDPPTSSIWTIDNFLSTERLETTLSKSSAYPVVEADRDRTILADASGGAFTITLLAAATAGDGFRLTVKKVDSGSNAVTVDGNSSETIDGALTYALYNQYDTVDLICDGSNWHLKAKELSDIHGGSGQILEIDRATTITSGNLTLTSGDLALSAGSISQIDSDSRTNTVAYPLILDVATTGTPAAGIGTGIEFRAESADEVNSPWGRLIFEADDVGAGTEDTYLALQARVAGAALATIYEFKNTGTSRYVFTGAPSAERTITLPDSDLTLSDIPTAAFQADQETATSTTTYVSPGRQQWHPSAAKGWLQQTGGASPTATSSYNVTSITDVNVGIFTINWATDFSSANFAVTCCPADSGTDGVKAQITSKAVGTTGINTYSGGSTKADLTQGYDASAFGDQ